MKRLAILVLLVACGSKKPEAAKPDPTTTTTTAATADVLELGEMKLVDVNKNKAVLIHADGSIEYEGVKGAIVTKDGKITNDKGEVGFALQPDGTIKGPENDTLSVTLTAEGANKSGDKTISLDENGGLLGSNPDAPQMRIEGATTTGLKRTAMFVLIALTTPSPTPESAPSPTAPAQVPVK
jgi:hypothetical protein